MHVAGTNLWSAGPYTLVCYESRDNRIADKYFYTCEEQINELIVAQLPSSKEDNFNPVLACQDSTIKVLTNNGKFLY